MQNTQLLKPNAKLKLEIEQLKSALDKSNNQLHILSKGNAELFSDSSQNLYYSISNLAVKSVNLEQLYYDIHTLLKKVIDVNNFIIALYDNKFDYIHFPYYVDEHFEGVVQSTKRKIGKGLTEYNLFKGTTLFLYDNEIEELIKENKVVLTGSIPKIWMGVPLMIDDKIIGLIGIKSYHNRNKYNLKHLEMLDFISSQIAVVIERKRSEEKLNFQNARIKAIFESSSHLMWSVNRKLALTSFNHNYAESIILFHNAAPKLNLVPDSLNKMLSNTEYINFVLEKYQLTFEGKPQQFETSNTLPSGHEIWWEIYLNPIFQTNGAIEEVSGIAHDITQKKLAGFALQESEEKFRDIFESFQDIYYRTTLNGEVLMISPSVSEFMGYTADEIIGKKLTDFYELPQTRESFEDELLLNGNIKNYETNIRTKYGTVIQTISNARVIYNKKNEPMAIEGVARDITSLKMANEELRNAKELAEKSLKVKQLFLANMSHEIRTPMNGVIGMIDLLSESVLDEEQKDYVNTIKRSSETLLTILNDILDLSKLEAGKMQLRPSPISIENTIAKLFALFKNLADAKDLKLQYSISEDVPLFINADETRFLQILANLTSNAIKFTEKGEISIIVKRAGKKGIKFVVQDTGIGISKENVKLLFNSFNQIDDSSSKAYSGSGLGLAISKELSTLMGGTIGVKSTQGEGSIFWFTIAVQPVDKIELVKIISEPNINHFRGFGNITPKILLVDDNYINRKVASQILIKGGCEVEMAENGMEAIIKVIENTYSLIFMDIQMPEMDGVTATKKIRQLRIKNLAPIIAMTAYSMEDDKNRFILAGMDDYLAKPIKSETIINMVRKWVLKEEDHSLTEIAKINSSNLIINMDIVQQLEAHLDSKMIADVYFEFECEASLLIEQCQTKDLATIKSNVHTLKGNASTLGIDCIAQLSKEIESNIKVNNTANIEAQINKLQVSFLEYKNNYKKILNINIHTNV